MKSYFVTFANKAYYGSIQKLYDSVNQCKAFDIIKAYTDEDLKSDAEFWQRHGLFIENNTRGYGYWLWKPYVVMKTLALMSDGDVLVYCDAGCTFNEKGLAKMRNYIARVASSVCGILGYAMEYNMEKKWTKNDLFMHLRCERLQDTAQIMATTFMMRKCELSDAFVKLWFETAIARNYSLLDDNASLTPNDPVFKEHRHDQSIFSLLFKIYNGESLSDEPERYTEADPIWATRLMLGGAKPDFRPDRIEFYYGTKEKRVNVTSIAANHFLSSNKLSVAGANNFNNLFSDVAPNQLKTLEIRFLDDQTCVSLPETRSKDYVIVFGKKTKLIPKRIVQYWDQSIEKMPDWAKNRTATLRAFHNTFSYELFDYKDAIKLIGQYFDKKVLLAFRKCNIAAMRSDLFRYCYLFVNGGYYFDLKTVCRRSFLNGFNETVEMILMKRQHEFLYNGFIGSCSGTKALADTIDECVANILNETFQELYLTTGTPIFTKHCKRCFGDKLNSPHVATIDYDQDNCPIVFAAAEYETTHWSIQEKTDSIYKRLDLRALLRVDNIFLLNLAKRTDRLQQAKAEFENLLVQNTQWERFEAFLGADKELQQRFDTVFATMCEKHKCGTDNSYVQGGFGCLLSHYHIIKTAKERGYKRVFILEDDFETTPLFNNVALLAKIGSLDFGMFYLSTSTLMPPLPTSDPDIVTVQRAVAACAYIVNYTVFDLILDQCLAYAMQIDLFYADIVQKQCKVLSTAKSIVIQREGFSDIVQRNIKYTFET